MTFDLHKMLLLPVLTGMLVWMGAAGAQEAEPDTSVPPLQRRDAPAFPKVGDFEVLRGDFHIHTFHSDGKQTARQRVFEAWRHGFDVMAITDHGNFKAYEEAKPWAEALGIVLLRGMETGIKDNEHIVALGLADTYTPQDSHRWAETEGAEQVYYRDKLQQLTEAGAVALYAHPHVGLRDPIKWAIDEGHIQGIEVKNGVVGTGWGTVESHGTRCYPFAFDWALEHNLALFANSDIHQNRESSQPVTLVLTAERSPQAVLDAFRARRTVAWFDGMLWGREDLLAEMLRHLVTVEAVTGPEDDTAWLRIRNLGPVGLEAEVSGAETGEEPVRIEGHEETLVAVAGPAPEAIRIGWRNVWVGSDKTLAVEHAVDRE